MCRRVLLAVVLAGGACADAAALDPAGRAAVDRGVAYLRARYGGGAGVPPLGPGAGGVVDGVVGGHALGEAALAGLAMLEGGAPAADPVVQRLAAQVRQACLPDTATYHVALCVLFLDRLGEPADRPLIQLLGVKLYGGLSSTGGYGYQCGEGMALDSRLLASLRDASLNTKPAAPKADRPPGADGFQKPPAPKGKADPPPTGLHPVVEPYFRQVQAAIRSGGGRRAEAGDNSNTQFGLIGLWVAARNGLPADDAFALIEQRFLSTQNPDAGWGYSPGTGASTPAMTCAGLLGLAVGAGRHSTTPPDRRGPPPAARGDGFVPAPKAEKKEGPALEGVRNKRAVSAALTALGGVVRASSGGQLGGFVGLGNEYYLLWSVERVAMTYNLPTLGDVDWYAWGCAYILPSQQQDGSWPAVGLCSQDVDTCFAILFLMKSNVVTDLSAKLGAPAERTLRGGGAEPPPPLMKAPRQAQPPKPGENAPADPLAAASDADFPAKLAALRDAKGSENTQALAKAIPLLVGDRQQKARAALAERLTRMTAKTLKDMLKDGTEEVKRAACSAVATKGEKTLLPDLADLVGSPAEPVVLAARDALKALTGQDHGPAAGADAAAKAKAQAAWRAVIN